MRSPSPVIAASLGAALFGVRPSPRWPTKLRPKDRKCAVRESVHPSNEPAEFPSAHFLASVWSLVEKAGGTDSERVVEL